MMCRQIFQIIVLCVSACCLQAQDGFIMNDFERMVKVSDANGRPFVNPPWEVTGSAFFNAAWRSGSVLLEDSVRFRQIPLRLNLETQQVHFLSRNGTEVTLPAGLVRKLWFADTVQDKSVEHIFQCGFPPVSDMGYSNFYLLLSEGKIRLLESITKKLKEYKNELSGEVTREYITYESYYFYDGEAMYLIKKDKNFVMGFMKDKEHEVLDYLSANGLAFKTVKDIQKIVEYYNSL